MERSAPTSAWWAYAPLTSRAFSPPQCGLLTIAVLVSGFGSIGRRPNQLHDPLDAVPGMTLAGCL